MSVKVKHGFTPSPLQGKGLIGDGLSSFNIAGQLNVKGTGLCIDSNFCVKDYLSLIGYSQGLSPFRLELHL